MSIDRRLREGFRASADVVRPHPLIALRTVERRVVRWRRHTLVLRIAVAAIAITAVVVALPWSTARLRTQAPVASPPAAPVVAGTWVVDIGDSTLARAEGMVGRWVVELAPGGAVSVVPPDSFTEARTGTSYQLDGDRLRTNLFVNDLCDSNSSTSVVGTYRWVSTASTLRFVAVSDSCEARRLFYTGQAWEKR